MSNKGKTQGRQVFGQKPPAARPAVPLMPSAPVVLESPDLVVAPESLPTPPTLAITEPIEPEPTVAPSAPAEFVEVAPVVEPVAKAVPVEAVELAPITPIEVVAPAEQPVPVRRGHLRAKVLVHGLVATGYTFDGEYRTRWCKGDVGEFLKASVDGIYLEAL